MAPGHPREGGGGQQTGTYSGRFSTNVMLHGNHTCCASRTGHTGVRGGLKGSGQSSPSSCTPSSADDDEVEEKKRARAGEEEITISPVHEKKSWILSPYSQFAIALPPSSFPALICIPRGTSPTSVFSLNTPEILEIARKYR